MEWIQAKTMVAKTKSNDWFGTDYNMNIYKGCSHGCIYCDSRSECYRIERFDDVRAKASAINLLQKELSGKKKTGVIGTGAMSDPYNPYEAELELTRQALSVIAANEFGVFIATKGSLVARDVDLLLKIKKHSPVLVMITITCSNDTLSKQIEPGAPPTSERFRALKVLADAGIYCGVLLMPVLPYLLDTEENIGSLLNQAVQSGCRAVYPGFGVTLRQNQRDWYYKNLDAKFPGLKQRYIETFGEAYSCQSPNAKNLYGLVASVCNPAGIEYKMRDITAAYQQGYESRQLSMF